MRHNDAQDAPIEGFDAGELPGMGPGGIPGAEDRKVAPPPPRLCEVGPCVHYHRFAIQLDVEGPKADNILAGGKLEGAAPKQPFHVRVHHYCYPDVGIETELGSLPVLECNRWEPRALAHEQMLADERGKFFVNDPRGQKYTEQMTEWRVARELEEAANDDSVVTWVAMNLRDGQFINVCDPEPFNEEADLDQPCTQCGAAAGQDCAPAVHVVTPHLGDKPREVAFPSTCGARPRKPGTGRYTVRETLEDDAARAFLTSHYLKERYDTGVVRLEIRAPATNGDEPSELVATTEVEIQ